MLSLQKVTEAEATLFGNLFQFFVHDLAAVDEPVPMHDGRYVIDHLGVYHTHPGMEAMLICTDEVPVGFVVVSVPPHFMDTYCVQHLFVLNGHRRKGIASGAMTLVFRQFPGAYRVGQPYEHQSSIDFWKTLYAAAGIEYEETVEGEGLDKELVQRFVV